ncbi:hypothetical protein CYK37_06655 [Mesorhizobium loti]|nr:hypothetical protein [Mesorhizobium loti]PLP59864.1 hypothetical protein CYK37_06655 [Mesorhizobium loti]
MSRNLKTAIIGIIIALVAGLAVNYGLISQQTADEIKAKTDEVLTNEQAAQPREPTTQQTAPQAPDAPSVETTQTPEQEAQTPSQSPASTGGQEPAQPAPAN